MHDKYAEIKFHLEIALKLTKSLESENVKFYRFREIVIKGIDNSSKWLDEVYYDYGQT